MAEEEAPIKEVEEPAQEQAEGVPEEQAATEPQPEVENQVQEPQTEQTAEETPPPQEGNAEEGVEADANPFGEDVPPDEIPQEGGQEGIDGVEEEEFGEQFGEEFGEEEALIQGAEAEGEPGKEGDTALPHLEAMDEATAADHKEIVIEAFQIPKDDEDTTQITGDFEYKPPSIFGSEEGFSIRVSEGDVQGLDEEVAEEEEETVAEVEEEEEEEEVDRDSLYERYIKLIQDYNSSKRRNMYLMRKMAEYYKKRRMDHVLKEGENYEENLRKYYIKLDAFGELKQLEERERTTITAEINEMRDQRNSERAQLKGDFESMQSKERHIGIGLTFAKTGKQIPDKLVERYLRNQRQKTKELSALRVAYIRMRDKIQEKQNALDDLDKIGDNFHLMDYEQLKIENRNHNDKIEERDEELGRLREKCIAAIECLAHIREKAAEVQLQITEHTTLLEETEMESWECRERVNYFKLERDNLRAEIERLKEESGLLTKGKLLCDMEATQKVREDTQKELNSIIDEYNQTKSLIAQLKTYIEDIEVKIRFFGPIKRQEEAKDPDKYKKGKFSPRDPVEYSHIKFGH